jgi:methionine-rich copper-binding protein CopC
MKSLLRVLALSASLVAGSAFAHTELSQSVPADQAALEVAPKEVMLHFSQAVRLTALSVTKQGESPADLGPLPAGTNEHFVVPAGDLAAGAYTVEWRALAGDGHALRGAFTFTVGSAAASGSQPRSESADHSRHSGRTEHSEHSQH